MSEYQYYEFVAIDQPLTAAQQRELRAVSTRGQISASSFVNDYEWGDLKADPRDWMNRYFDAFLYFANWGTHRIALRWPIGVLNPDTAAAYCIGTFATAWSTRTHVVIDMCSEDDADEEWWNQERALAPIAPVRSELAAGDHRLLYLAWLLCVQNEEVDDDTPEPPIPPGMTSLSGPLQALARFLRLDSDLLSVAIGASATKKPRSTSASTLPRWVAKLPTSYKDEVIRRLMEGEDPHLRSELLGKFHDPTEELAATRRTAGELLAEAETLREARRQRDHQRAGAERDRKAKQATAERQARLTALARRRSEAWDDIEAFIATKRPTEYDSAVELLLDLKTLAEATDDLQAFARRLSELRERHGRKRGLLDRLDRQRLT